MEDHWAYPDAPRTGHEEPIGGRLVRDPYRWLENPRHPDTAAWLAGQGLLFERWRSNRSTIEGVRLKLLAATASETATELQVRGGRHFYIRQGAKDAQPSLVTSGVDGSERTLFRPAGDHEVLDSWALSPSGRSLVCQTSTEGSEDSTLFLMNTATGRQEDDPIEHTWSSTISWLDRENAFVYRRRIPHGRGGFGYELRRHVVGRPSGDDEPVFAALSPPDALLRSSASPDGGWLVVTARRRMARVCDIWIAEAAGAEFDFRQVQRDLDCYTHAHVAWDGRLYLLTDLRADRRRLCVSDPAHPGPDHWRTLIPEDDEATIEDYIVLQDVIVVKYARHAVSCLAVFDRQDGRRIGDIPLPGLGTVRHLTADPAGGGRCWFTYTDAGTPPRMYEYDLTTHRLAPSRESVAAPQLRLPRIVTEHLGCTSRDGTTVRMLVTSRVDAPPVPKPTLVHAYGGFGVSVQPSYSPLAAAWIAAGGRYVIANVRGGGEEGRRWHQAACRVNKVRSCEDLEAVTDALVSLDLTSADQLVLMGNSNGGLLVATALTRRPAAYRAVICSSPLTDMVRYDRFGLGHLWIDEYGTASSAGTTASLLGYSPYHNVVQGAKYPAVLFTVGAADTRVDPLHARKLTAALQNATSADPDTHPILLRYAGKAGHGSGTATTHFDLLTDILVFAAWATGLDIAS